MRNSLALMLLAGACCLVFSQAAKADVNTITEVSYYEPTNSILAWAEVIPDYDTLAYYCFDDWGQISKDDAVVSSFWGGSCDNESYYEEFFPYDPDAQYTIEVYPQLIAKARHDYGDTYEDYYNYIEWTNGQVVYYPYYFGFTGAGPNVQISPPNISLGGVFSIFTMGGTSGQPHHLKVITDRTLTYTGGSCSRALKEIDYQVVDVNNRPAGKVPIEEKTPNPPVTDSCSNITVAVTPCIDWATNLSGNFTDSLKTGCPNAGKPADCGFDLGNTWRWCPRIPYFALHIPIAWVYYDVRRTYIKVDGEEDITDNTYKYP